MLPGPVLVMLKVLAWLSMPLWAADGVSAFALDIRAVFLVSMLALAATFSALALHAHDRMDARLTKGLEAQQRCEAEMARIAAAAVDGGVTVEPSPQPAPDLRLVRGPRASSR